jgi:thioredoxin reductase (NADPH)
MHPYDVLIIGGGPIGLACGIAAQRAGLRYLILEKGTLVNSLFNYPLFMTFFSTAERLEIGGVPFMSLAPKPGRQEAMEYYRRVTEHYKLSIRLFEAVEAVKQEGPHRFTVTTTKGQYQATNVIVATGFYDLPVLMGIPGEDLPKVSHYYKEPHFYAFQDVVIVGAANSAIDAALEIWRRGGRVTLVIRGSEIGSVKYWIRPDIENRIQEGSIRACFNSTLVAVRENEVELDTPEGRVTLPNDWVLALTGYQPDFELLRRFGIALAPDESQCPVYNPETMETNISGIYLAGVVCGGMNTRLWFIENSREHADQIIQAILADRQRATGS